MTTSSSNLVYKLFLSNDDQRDASDHELFVTVGNLANMYKTVTDLTTTAEPDQFVVFGTASFTVVSTLLS